MAKPDQDTRRRVATNMARACTVASDALSDLEVRILVNPESGHPEDQATLELLANSREMFRILCQMQMLIEAQHKRAVQALA